MKYFNLLTRIEKKIAHYYREGATLEDLLQLYKDIQEVKLNMLMQEPEEPQKMAPVERGGGING